MSRLWDIRKKNATIIMNLKEMCPDGKIPAGTLIAGREGITDQLKQFLLMKELDENNEKWKGPRKYTMDQLSNTANYTGPLVSDDPMAYQLLANAQNQQARRTTMPSTTNKKLLNPEFFD